MAKELISFGVSPILSFTKSCYLANGHEFPQEFLNTPLHNPFNDHGYMSNRLYEAYDVSEELGIPHIH
jgi:hypothetical protein